MIGFNKHFKKECIFRKTNKYCYHEDQKINNIFVFLGVTGINLRAIKEVLENPRNRLDPEILITLFCMVVGRIWA